MGGQQPEMAENILPEFLIFDAIEPSALAVAEIYLEEQGLTDFLKRLREGRFIGVGSQRLLLHTWHRLLDGDVQRLVEFYQGSQRPSDDPHYEDLFTTILLGIISGLATNLIWQRSKQSQRLQSAIEELRCRTRRALVTLEYLLKAAAARARYWKRQITKEEFGQAQVSLEGAWRKDMKGICKTKDDPVYTQDETAEIIDRLVTLASQELKRRPDLVKAILRVLEEAAEG